MTFQSIGDMAQHFQTLRQGTSIKDRLNALSNELSSGRVADLAAKLRGETGQLGLLDRELALIDSFDATNRQLAAKLEQKQIVLGTLDAAQTKLGARWLTVSVTSSDSEFRTAGIAGRDGMNQISDLLNTRLGDRSLFAGAAEDGPAVIRGDAMLADIVASIGGATDLATITTRIDAWFDDPAGGFATMGYLGDTGATQTRQAGGQMSLSLDGRADDQGFRDLLKANARAAVSEALSATLDRTTRADLIRGAGDRTFAATDTVRAIAARISDGEQRLDESSTQLAAQRLTFATARNTLVAADPFETATLLQNVQQQLELHYTATARLSRLSLVNYL